MIKLFCQVFFIIIKVSNNLWIFLWCFLWFKYPFHSTVLCTLRSMKRLTFVITHILTLVFKQFMSLLDACISTQNILFLWIDYGVFLKVRFSIIICKVRTHLELCTHRLVIWFQLKHYDSKNLLCFYIEFF